MAAPQDLLEKTSAQTSSSDLEFSWILHDNPINYGDEVMRLWQCQQQLVRDPNSILPNASFRAARAVACGLWHSAALAAPQLGVYNAVGCPLGNMS